MGTVTLFELDQEDINDLLQLIASPSLTIPANYARRVYELQTKLANLKPSAALEDERKAHEVTRGALDATEKQRQEWIDKHAKAKAELLELKGTTKVWASIEAAANVAVCDCGHGMKDHDSDGCLGLTCPCAKSRT